MPQSLHKQTAGATSTNTSSQMWAVNKIHSCVCSQRLWLLVTYFCCCSLLQKQLKLLKCHCWVKPTAENLSSWCLQNHLWLKNEWILQNPPWKFPDCISPPNREKNMIIFCLLENAFSSFVEASSCKFFFWFWGEISRNLVRFPCWCWLCDFFFQSYHNSHLVIICAFLHQRRSASQLVIIRHFFQIASKE